MSSVRRTRFVVVLVLLAVGACSQDQERPRPISLPRLGGEWKSVPYEESETQTLRFGPDDVWTFEDAEAQHRDGKKTSRYPIKKVLSAAGFSSRDVWVRTTEKVQHWDGVKWSIVRTPTLPFELAPVGPNDVWGVFSDKVPLWHWNGSDWSGAEVPHAKLENVVALSTREVWASGNRILTYDGKAWRDTTPKEVEGMTFSDLASDGDGGIWVAIRQRPYVLHFGNGRWNQTRLPVPDAGGKTKWSVTELITNGKSLTAVAYDAALDSDAEDKAFTLVR